MRRSSSFSISASAPTCSLPTAGSLLVAAAVFLFIAALDVRSWADAGAGMFALTVFTGLHTFRGTVREAFPINHFLEIVVLCLVALNLARLRGGWWVDLAAAVTFVVASLTLESGLLVWVVLCAAWACGLRGVSRRGLVLVTVLLVAYFGARFALLHAGTPGLSERSSGFWLEVLEPDELQRRFGDGPLPFYAYNVGASIMSVLFSEPQDGVFVAVRSWLSGDVPPRVYVAVVSSILTTLLIGWATVACLRGLATSRNRPRDALLLLFPIVLVANAALSYAYTKDEIITVAGAFYALAAFAAVRYLVDRVVSAGSGEATAPGTLAVVALMLVVAALWAVRSAGVHHMLRVEAFKVRNDWASLPPDRYAGGTSPSDQRAAALVRQMRRSAFEARVTNPYLLPRWADRWLGE
jgi:hypothetical protein